MLFRMLQYNEQGGGRINAAFNSVHKQRRGEQENKTIYESAACPANLASFVRRPVILIILLGLRRWH